MNHEHVWGIWAASFLYFGRLGSVRRCTGCPAVDRAVLGGHDSERRNRVAHYLSARLAR